MTVQEYAGIAIHKHQASTSMIGASTMLTSCGAVMPSHGAAGQALSFGGYRVEDLGFRTVEHLQYTR